MLKKNTKSRNKQQKLKKSISEVDLEKLHIEMVKLQEWIKHEQLEIVVVFEGRDAAGKAGANKLITGSLNPRLCRVVALAAPAGREKSQ